VVVVVVPVVVVVVGAAVVVILLDETVPLVTLLFIVGLVVFIVGALEVELDIVDTVVFVEFSVKFKDEVVTTKVDFIEVVVVSDEDCWLETDPDLVPTGGSVLSSVIFI